MRLLAIAAITGSLALAAAPAQAQHHGGGGFHGGGFHGGGFRGGFRGGFGGPRFGFGFGFGPGCWSCGYYAPYYDPYFYPAYAPYAYAPPYPPDDYAGGYDAPLPPPPPPQDQPRASNDGPNEGDWYVTRRRGETDYEMPDKVLFALDSATISFDADRSLAQVADAARREPGARLIVEGHTDTSGTPDHNLELSDARARAVADVLVREGIPRSRITSEGLGERDLAVQTGDGVREARNRRVVIRLIDGHTASRAPMRDEEEAR